MPHGCLSEATPGHTLDCLDRPRRQILYRHLQPGVSPPAKQPCYRGSIQRRECAGQVSRKTHPMIDREHLHREGYELLRGAIARPCELHPRPRPVKLKALAGAPGPGPRRRIHCCVEVAGPVRPFLSTGTSRPIPHLPQAISISPSTSAITSALPIAEYLDELRKIHCTVMQIHVSTPCCG